MKVTSTLALVEISFLKSFLLLFWKSVRIMQVLWALLSNKVRFHLEFKYWKSPSSNSDKQLRVTPTQIPESRNIFQAKHLLFPNTSLQNKEKQLNFFKIKIPTPDPTLSTAPPKNASFKTPTYGPHTPLLALMWKIFALPYTHSFYPNNWRQLGCLPPNYHTNPTFKSKPQT